MSGKCLGILHWLESGHPGCFVSVDGDCWMSVFFVIGFRRFCCQISRIPLVVNHHRVSAFSTFFCVLIAMARWSKCWICMWWTCYALKSLMPLRTASSNSCSRAPENVSQTRYSVRSTERASVSSGISMGGQEGHGPKNFAWPPVRPSFHMLKCRGTADI